jgi:hypothetical protein
MQALHSSAAMAVNLFDYFRQQRTPEQAAKILRIPSPRIAAMTFERKYPVIANYREHGLTEPPHLDVGFDYEHPQRVGVECKLFEPYGRLEHAGLRDAYLDLPDVWNDIPACRKLAEELVEGSAGFIRLGPAQLLRHILGLKFGISAGQFRLVYLYYDAPGDEAAAHRSEIKRFSELISTDGIGFQAMSVQRFIIRAASVLSDEHIPFVNYLSERYL